MLAVPFYVTGAGDTPTDGAGDTATDGAAVF